MIPYKKRPLTPKTSQIRTSSEMMKEVAPRLAEYSLFGSIYDEITRLRDETTATLIHVRLNEKHSPYYLNPAITILKSFFIPLSMVVHDSLITVLNDKWIKLRDDTQSFLKIHATSKRRKIPQELIDAIDQFFIEVGQVYQAAGLGIKLSDPQIDYLKSIEATLIGE